ncbi:MAG TPA: DinB family protein [Thermomicrobiales bacterium]|nr:DinB family protein [Thermomicrobiales bacterium]
MAEHPEIALLSRKLTNAVDRIFECVGGLDAEGLNWKPPAPEANSLYILGTHIIGNVKQNVLVVLGGGPDDRDRDAEFEASGASAHELLDRWTDVKAQITARLTELGGDILDRSYDHPRRGPSSGRELLINAVAHANEHIGHAELTRQLYDAR